VAEWSAILDKGTMSDACRPTVWDVVVRDAIEFAASGERGLVAPEDAFELDAAGPALAPLDEFLAWQPAADAAVTDTDSPLLETVGLYQDLLAFHRGDADRTALLSADLDRILWAAGAAVSLGDGTDVTQRKQAALEAFVTRAGDHETAALARYHLAELEQSGGDLVAARAVMLVEIPWFAHRPLWHLMFGGVFDRHPSEPGAARLDRVETIDAGIESLARDRLGGLSKGGMASKIAAARIATEAGSHCIIASGRDDRVLESIVDGQAIGTLFVGRGVTMPAWKRWLGWSADSRGRIFVDSGAQQAVVAQGRSLLAAGVRRLEGSFATGDVVSLAGEDGREFARGLVNYPEADLQRIVPAVERHVQ
jgi:hypothetical protein